MEEMVALDRDSKLVASTPKQALCLSGSVLSEALLRVRMEETLQPDLDPSRLL
jgi:hypothetical protein